MRLRRWVIIAVLTGLVATSVGAVEAITINLVFQPGGTRLPGLPQFTFNGNVLGGGTLESVVRAAADVWEDTILDTHTVRIDFGWASLGSGILAQEVDPGDARPTRAFIQFTSRSIIPWFMDPTALDNSEYTTFQSTSTDFGVGLVNSGRVFSGNTGDAENRVDLFTVALHEIGHALGLGLGVEFSGQIQDRDIDITAPRPFAGSQIPTISTTNPHLSLPNGVMQPSLGFERLLPSDADILAIAQVTDYRHLVLTAPPAAVTEPATWLVVLGALPLVGVVLRRH